VRTQEQELWEVGDRLKHEVFGEGVIVDILNSGEQQDLIVSFDQGSKRRIRPGYIRLVKVEEDII